MNKKQHPYLLSGLMIGLVLSLFISACTTKKNTFRHRAWHNVNAHYNGYFLADEAAKITIAKIETTHKDDFSELLPIFIYPDKENVEGYSGDFDSVIKQASSVVHRHTIVNARSKVEIADAGKWIDDTYIIIGKSNLYKREYAAALESFEYVSKKYPEPEAKYPGMLWMMRTFNELKTLDKTETILDDLRNVEDLPDNRKFSRDLALITADYHIKRKSYQQAITSLEGAIELTRKKQKKARYLFLLAQLYEQQNSFDDALNKYDETLKLHPNYDMTFNAEMKKAYMYIASGQDSKSIQKHLLKMAKDGKNAEYRDQIYYVLAQVVEKDGQTELAMTYLKQSIENSISNQPQKALSFLKLGQMHYKQQDYVRAELNYDSAVTFLSEDYPDYNKVKTTQKNLSGLVENLNTIALQDSLQVLALMTPKERKKAINNHIKILQEKELAEDAEAKRLAAIREQNVADTKSANVKKTSSKAWYFYNPKTVEFGKSEFQNLWGDRKLEDNWRRSDKIQNDAGADDDFAGDEERDDSNDEKEQNGVTEEKYTAEFYLKDIPLKKEELDASIAKSIEAYYNVGLIYKEQFANNQKSVETFEELLKRYPDNKYQLTIYYQLYRTYLSMGNKTKSNYYKNILLNKHPNTTYAKLIQSPNYVNNIAADKDEVEAFYGATFTAYKNKQFQQVIINSTRADSLYGANAIIQKFDYLRALSYGETHQDSLFKEALTKIVAKHPQGAIKEEAQTLLDLLDKQTHEVTPPPIVKDSVEVPVPVRPNFTFEDEAPYNWVISFSKDSAHLDKFTLLLENITLQYFKKDSLQIDSISVDSLRYTFVVKTFKNKAHGLKYYQFYKAKPTLFVGVINEEQSCIVSNKDLALITDSTTLAQYFTFFARKND